MSTCPAIIKSGRKKGQACGRPMSTCPYHDNSSHVTSSATGTAVAPARSTTATGLARGNNTTAPPTPPVLTSRHTGSCVQNLVERGDAWALMSSSTVKVEDMVRFLQEQECGTKENTEGGGSLNGTLKSVVLRRLIAWMWENGKISHSWDSDSKLVACVSPLAAFGKTKLREIATDLGLSLRPGVKDTNSDMLLAVVDALERYSQQPSARLERSGEELRRGLVELLLFDPLHGLVKVLPPSRVVDEAKQALSWTKEDCAAVTPDSRDILDTRVKWLEGLKASFQGNADKISGHPLEPAWKYARDSKKRVLQELATLKAFPALHCRVARHHQGQAFPACTMQQLRGAVASSSCRTYFQDLGIKDLAQSMASVLRKPQEEALKAVHMHHKTLQGIPSEAGQVLDSEQAAIKTLRHLFQQSVRESYFAPPTSAGIQRARDHIRFYMERVAMSATDRSNTLSDERASLLVLPTGLGKSILICLLPFMLPLERTGRVLVVAPNLTIAGSVSSKDDSSKDAQAEGLMKDFCDAQWNCYHAHGILSKDSPLPLVGGLKGLPGNATAETLEQYDVIVTNYHQLKARKLEGLLPRNFFDAIIIDEAHHAESQSYKFIFDHFAAAHKVLLTATPFRGDRKQLAAREIYRTSMKVCIALEYIKDIIYCPVPVGSYDLVNTTTGAVYKHVSGWDEVEQDGRKKVTQDACLESPEVRSSIIKHAMDCLRWIRGRTGHKHQAIVQALDIADAVKICKEWREHPDHRNNNFSIDFVASNEVALSDEETKWHHKNDEVKKRLRNGLLDVIVHVGMLGEGFDHKRLSVAVIFKPFRNIGSYSQFVGRAIRRDTTRPKGKPCGPEEQVAYVIAHPALGLGEAWKVYCSELQDEAKELKAEGNKADVPYILRHRLMLPSPFEDGTVARAITSGAAAGDPRVRVFPRNLSEAERRMVSTATSQQKSHARAEASTPTAVLDARVALSSGRVRSSSTASSSGGSSSSSSGSISSNVLPMMHRDRAAAPQGTHHHHHGLSKRLDKDPMFHP